MRVRLPIVFLLSLCVVASSTSLGMSQKTESDPPVFYRKVRDFFIPFKVDPKRPIKELRLFAQRNGSEWEYLTTALPTQKGFKFTTNQDGTYAMAVQTIFQDGSQDPPRDQLQPDAKVVIDTVPPKITVRPYSTNDGAAGVEWDIVDDNLDPSSIRLEYRWPNMVDWAPIDRGISFRAHDHRIWGLKPTERIEIRVRATDLAKNEGVSAPVTTSLTVGDQRQFGGSTTGNSGGTGANAGTGEQVILPQTVGNIHYVNSTLVKLNYHVTVGPSGVKKVSLWRQDDKQPWGSKPVQEKSGSELRPDGGPVAVHPGESPKTELLTFVDDVKKDGVYGYIIIVESRAGASGKEPKPGDPAHRTVIVDTIKPDVKMLEPKVRPNGTAAQGALVDISWTATDKNMAAAPITLEYAEKLDGNWRVIADKIDNTGKYTWAVPPTEPYSFYIRVRAVDRANNWGEATSKEAVIVDLTVPQVEIHEVVPVPASGSTPPR